jgi:hypothetical protein
MKKPEISETKDIQERSAPERKDPEQPGRSQIFSDPDPRADAELVVPPKPLETPGT